MCCPRQRSCHEIRKCKSAVQLRSSAENSGWIDKTLSKARGRGSLKDVQELAFNLEAELCGTFRGGVSDSFAQQASRRLVKDLFLMEMLKRSGLIAPSGTAPELSGPLIFRVRCQSCYEETGASCITCAVRRNARRCVQRQPTETCASRSAFWRFDVVDRCQARKYRSTEAGREV